METVHQWAIMEHLMNNPQSGRKLYIFPQAGCVFFQDGQISYSPVFFTDENQLVFLLHSLLHSRSAWLKPPFCNGFRPDSSVFDSPIEYQSSGEVETLPFFLEPL